MPLNQQHVMTLLKDILNDHKSDCCGSVSECEQLERLVKSLMVDYRTNNDAKDILSKIYSYSQDGINSTNLDQHIESHQQQLSQWASEIDQFS